MDETIFPIPRQPNLWSSPSTMTTNNPPSIYDPTLQQQRQQYNAPKNTLAAAAALPLQPEAPSLTAAPKNTPLDEPTTADEAITVCLHQIS